MTNSAGFTKGQATILSWHEHACWSTNCSYKRENWSKIILKDLYLHNGSFEFDLQVIRTPLILGEDSTFFIKLVDVFHGKSTTIATN